MKPDFLSGWGQFQFGAIDYMVLPDLLCSGLGAVDDGTYLTLCMHVCVCVCVCVCAGGSEARVSGAGGRHFNFL